MTENQQIALELMCAGIQQKQGDYEAASSRAILCK
jgi:hypothetical protein